MSNGSFVRVQIIGLEGLSRKLKSLGDGIAGAHLDSAVQAGAAVVQADVIRRMRMPKSGKVYTRKGGRRHRASAPGEAPAIDFGTLVNSITVDIVQRGRSFVVAAVGTNVEYGIKLELGSSRQRSRPFLRPAMDENEGAIKRVIIAELKRRINAD